MSEARSYGKKKENMVNTVMDSTGRQTSTALLCCCTQTLALVGTQPWQSSWSCCQQNEQGHPWMGPAAFSSVPSVLLLISAPEWVFVVELIADQPVLGEKMVFASDSYAEIQRRCFSPTEMCWDELKSPKLCAEDLWLLGALPALCWIKFLFTKEELDPQTEVDKITKEEHKLSLMSSMAWNI